MPVRTRRRAEEGGDVARVTWVYPVPSLALVLGMRDFGGMQRAFRAWSPSPTYMPAPPRGCSAGRVRRRTGRAAASRGPLRPRCLSAGERYVVAR
jgi:hypothetical protein